MGKLNTIIEKVIHSSGMTLSQIIEKAIHNVNEYQTTELNSANHHDIYEIVKCCREKIQSFEDTRIVPSPRYFEQVAVLSRKEKNYDKEIAICEIYIELINQYAARNNITDAKVSTELLPKCAPFVKRLQNAKTMSAKA